MTALALHTVLTVVLIAWGYEVATRVPYRQAWIWTGTSLVIVIGYISLTARSVFEGAPTRVQTVVGNVGATLLALAGVVCLALFAAVAHGANRSMAQPLHAAATEPSAWAPSEETSVIADDDAVVWEPGAVIDAGFLPSSDSSVDEEPQGARYAYSSPDEPDEPDDSPMASVPARAPAPDAPAATPATSVYRPDAPPAVAASEWTPTSSADEEAWERVTPRRALPSPSDMGS